MAARSDRTITEALGFPDSNDGAALDFSANEVSGIMDANSTYRIAATEDCYLKITTPGGGGDVDSDDMLVFGSIPEVIQTTKNQYQFNVLRKSADGTLHLTRMKTPSR